MKLDKNCYFIIGAPASGKTRFARMLKKENLEYCLISTDLFIKKEAELLSLINESILKQIKILVEGSLCYNLCYDFGIRPDVIFEITHDLERLAAIYTMERKSKNFHFAMKYHKDRLSKFNALCLPTKKVTFKI